MTRERQKNMFDEAWKNHRISVDIKPFPSYRDENGYYTYIHYRKPNDVNLSLWTRESSTIDEAYEKGVESVQFIINNKM